MFNTHVGAVPDWTERLAPPPKEYDKIVALPDVPAIIRETQAKVARINRLNELSDVCKFISTASLLERKHILVALIDADEIGISDQLEDAACAMTIELERELCSAPCHCDNCNAARSDEHFDRSHER